MNFHKLIPTVNFEEMKQIQANLSMMGVDYLMIAKQKDDNEFRTLFVIDGKHMPVLNGALPVSVSSNGEILNGYSMHELNEPLSKIAKEFFGISI